MPSAIATNINIANLRIADLLSSDRTGVLHPERISDISQVGGRRMARYIGDPAGLLRDARTGINPPSGEAALLLVPDTSSRHHRMDSCIDGLPEVAESSIALWAAARHRGVEVVACRYGVSGRHG
jgi:hypothetical protein